MGDNAGMARPRKELDIAEFEKLCSYQCTEEEICSWFDVTDKTLNKWCKDNYDGMGFSEVFRLKRGNGKVSLRRNLFQLSQKNAIVAIFLAKNWLGMTDNVAVKTDTSLMQSLLDVMKGNDNADAVQPEADTDDSQTIR